MLSHLSPKFTCYEYILNEVPRISSKPCRFGTLNMGADNSVTNSTLTYSNKTVGNEPNNHKTRNTRVDEESLQIRSHILIGCIVHK